MPDPCRQPQLGRLSGQRVAGVRAHHPRLDQTYCTDRGHAIVERAEADVARMKAI